VERWGEWRDGRAGMGERDLAGDSRCESVRRCARLGAVIGAAGAGQELVALENSVRRDRTLAAAALGGGDL
jgi:hypothetical protein